MNNGGNAGLRYVNANNGLGIAWWNIDESVRHTHATLRDGIFLRGTRSFRRFDKAPFLALARRCASYWGWFKHGNCEGVRIRRGIDKSMAHARRVVSASVRHDRLELMEGGNT